MEYLEIKDSKAFNFTITYSLLTKKKIKINILSGFEYKEDYVRLVCSITKGSSYEFDKKTSILLFNPGVLIGGRFIYTCKDEISNYIVPLLPALPFNGSQIFISFIGVTNNLHSVEMIKIAHFTLCKHFEIPGLELVVKKTGFSPEGQGQADLFCGSMSQIKNIDLSQPSELDKTRALLLSSRLNSNCIGEMSSVVTDLLGDLNLKIFSNVHNSKDSGPSPGYQCNLFMESKEGIFYAIKLGLDSAPREVVHETCLELLKSANRGGVLDEKLYPLLFSFLAISSTDISSVVISRITEETDVIIKLVRIFFNYEFVLSKLNDELLLKSSGCGYKNINRKIN
ncbi:RNA 3'-terminal phosphate cyclase-like protein [Nosema granulosis]|uniref:RNA 3'-terminal phosphate cyclase-like protein n=1 Tax=Nosema granulosis TaxID=83296 RepID=A0A9P6KZT9_9MICR|nr:RNA 3'-terminal phosphate cyclase-like protein [Nosema granulosis]